MIEDTFQQPNPEMISGFIDGDPIAINDVVLLVLPQVIRWALARYPDLPQTEVQSMVHQVLAETCVNHTRYNPKLSKFTSYLINLIRLRLVDLHKVEKEIAKFEDFSDEAQEKLINSPYNLTDTVDAATKITRDQFFALAMEQLDDEEKIILSMIREGEKNQDAFLVALQRFRPMTGSNHEVKNIKARLTRKLSNMARLHGYHYDDLIA